MHGLLQSAVIRREKPQRFQQLTRDWEKRTAVLTALWNLSPNSSGLLFSQAGPQGMRLLGTFTIFHSLPQAESWVAHASPLLSSFPNSVY